MKTGPASSEIRVRNYFTLPPLPSSPLLIGFCGRAKSEIGEQTSHRSLPVPGQTGSRNTRAPRAAWAGACSQSGGLFKLNFQAQGQALRVVCSHQRAIGASGFPSTQLRPHIRAQQGQRSDCHHPGHPASQGAGKHQGTEQNSKKKERTKGKADLTQKSELCSGPERRGLCNEGPGTVSYAFFL